MTHSKQSPSDPRPGMTLADRFGPRLGGADIMSGNEPMLTAPAPWHEFETMRDAQVDLGTEKTLELTVVNRDIIADGIVALDLSAPDGRSLPDWAPGAHIELVLDGSTIRQYSLIGSHTNSAVWKIAVRYQKAGRGGSIRVHEMLNVGSKVVCRQPRNQFALLPAERYVFIAGGIGITPILSMVRAAEEAGADWFLAYGGRSRDSMAFLNELSRHGEHFRAWPRDESGRIPLDSLVGNIDSPTRVYCCGPEPLLNAVQIACAANPSISLHFERFTPPQPETASSQESIEVELKASNKTVLVAPNQSILEAVEEAGVEILSSCRNGMCGTCETDVIEGQPEHRDCFLSKDEQASGATMMICVSRAKSPRLVLDL